MSAIIESFPFLMKGLLNTIWLSICCVLASIIFGVLIGIIRTIENRITSIITKIFITIFRGIPSLVVLFLVFFLLPTLGIHISSFLSAVIGLSLWGSANVAEAVRGSIQSIHKGQTEASYALGLNYPLTMRYVILPQATKRVLPSIIGILTNVIQSTALTVLIGNVEFLKSAQIQIERIEMSGQSSVVFILYAVVLIGYFLICYPLSLWSRNLEKQLKV
ncbi:amino acid ABC transporter permease [Neobacillus bataviensis LMG 21833]|uniref:Amino acid ABC transporter permease n=1 Tax=Neobacillus bataviensis LMG 21833 TaxID=1117379 RepID=K6DZV9_9BACI|nr:amino acid ABC transporter permease [Neobacillus bataviensis]EKN66436.1 amino acid ABC transporter permease [Neobacillus bataviensis LMG 21833]